MPTIRVPPSPAALSAPLMRPEVEPEPEPEPEPDDADEEEENVPSDSHTGLEGEDEMLIYPDDISE